jgi:L-fuconolactonase
MPHIIDSHLHFWDRERFRYPWLDDVAAPLGLSHRPADLAATGWSADSIVAVQADCLRHHGLAEAAWFSELADEGAPIVAIVAFAPLDAPERLATHLEDLAQLPRVAGVRRLLQDAEPGLAISAAFVEGVRSLAEYRLTMDLCIRDFQLPEATQLVEQVPEVQFVLDHLGKPTIRPDAFGSWAADLSRLAALPNVVVKLSGLLTEAEPGRRSSEALRPWLRHAIEAFGPTRCMFGSDWPVLDLGGGFARWVEIVSDALGDLDEGEATAIWSGTAAATYLTTASISSQTPTPE